MPQDYDIKGNVLYFDLFSCAYFDFGNIEDQLKEMFGEIESMQLITRGDKYVIIRRDDVDENRLYISGKWQKNI